MSLVVLRGNESYDVLVPCQSAQLSPALSRFVSDGNGCANGTVDVVSLNLACGTVVTDCAVTCKLVRGL